MTNQNNDQSDYTKIPSTDGTGTKFPALISAETREIAAWFCNLDHEDQAEFFLEVSRIAKTWQGAASNQWWWVGREISIQVAKDRGNEPAAEMIAQVSRGIEGS